MVNIIFEQLDDTILTTIYVYICACTFRSLSLKVKDVRNMACKSQIIDHRLNNLIRKNGIKW